MDDAPSRALAYALWDSRHTEKMVYPEDVDKHVAEADRVRRWLRVHGYALRKLKRKS